MEDECRGCGGDASNGFNGLCECCEEELRDQEGQNIDTSDFDFTSNRMG